MITISKMCSKSIETEAIFTKTEMDNEWNVKFLQNSFLGIQDTNSREISIAQNTNKTHHLICETAQSYFFSFNP